MISSAPCSPAELGQYRSLKLACRAARRPCSPGRASSGDHAGDLGRRAWRRPGATAAPCRCRAAPACGPVHRGRDAGRVGQGRRPPPLDPGRRPAARRRARDSSLLNSTTTGRPVQARASRRRRHGRLGTGVNQPDLLDRGPRLDELGLGELDLTGSRRRRTTCPLGPPPGARRPRSPRGERGPRIIGPHEHTRST